LRRAGALVAVVFSGLFPLQAAAQQPSESAPAVLEPGHGTPAAEVAADKPSHFFDHIAVRGYTQFRYNQLFANNERLINLQGDRSVGQNAGILIRRARLVFSGDIHPQVAMYLQTDFAASAGDTLNVGQIRDWYFDVALDADKELRLRVGQSKVPYGFENPQSSQNRLPMDRSDALNSAMPGERDLGAFLYYAPKEVRRRLKHLTEAGLKGSGDYGMAALGVYEGQSINLADTNDNKHVVARLSYPFKLGEQYIEAGVSGYTGKFVVRTDAGIVAAPDGVRDARAVAHFVLYPQPFGLQLEYNIGDGPQLDTLIIGTDADGENTFTGLVQRKHLHGGYALASLKLDTVIPYLRVMSYEGGKKQERNAPRYSVRELEGGIEWQALKALELTFAFTYARRSDGGRIPYEPETGRLARLQVQFNY
jgi:phosphate-selective porin O/P